MAGRRGRSVYYTAAWQSLRREALRRAGWRCAICGGYGREVHHLVPLHAGGDLLTGLDCVPRPVPRVPQGPTRDGAPSGVERLASEGPRGVVIFSRGIPGAGVERDALESIGRDPSPGSIHRTQGQICFRATEIQIKLSESRTALRALLADPPVEAATDEVREEHDTKVTEGQGAHGRARDGVPDGAEGRGRGDSARRESGRCCGSGGRRRRHADHAGRVPRVHGHRGPVRGLRVLRWRAGHRDDRSGARDAPGARRVRARRHPVADARGLPSGCRRSARSNAPRSPRVRRCGR